MNSIIRNNFCTTNVLIRLMKIQSFSTASRSAELLEVEELDKLYQTIEIELKANEPEVMKSYAQFAQMAANHLEIKKGKFWAPVKPMHERENLTLLRSAFVNKNCRVQYELRTYFRYMNFHHLTGSTADTFLEYLERNLPEGVAMKVTKVEVKKLPNEITRLPQSSSESESGNDQPQ